MRKLFLIGIVLTTLLSATAFARGPAVVVVGPGFGPYGWYGSYYGPYPYGPYLVANVGQVKLDTHVKEADVFIDGSYAGTLRDLKTMMMRPGNYDISVVHRGAKPSSKKHTS